MANKENQSPATVRYTEQCTPPGSASTALGLRPWQKTAFASPPFRAISPNSKPSLTQQRDHSACRRPDTPLKIRKTRENLRQDALYTDIPPPCLHLADHGEWQESNPRPNRQEDPSSAKSTEVHLTPVDSEACASSLPSLPPFHPDDYHSLMAVNLSDLAQPALSTPPRMRRHRSVSRRMLSKVRQGIASRGKATPTVRPTESETSLMRRISGRRKQSVEVERRAQSFEISRDSVATVVDDNAKRSLGEHHLQQSVSQTTISTTEALGDLSPELNVSSEHNSNKNLATAGIPLVTEIKEDLSLTPRPLHSSLAGRSISAINVCIPFIKLEVTLDRTAVDAGSEQQAWTALEASVDYRDCSIRDGTMEGLEDSRRQFGAITSLRLCFKPVGGCSIVDILGQKGLKNLTANQTCSLFIKVQVPKVQAACTADDDQASLFTELECMVGTRQTELLHLEARYRHSLLPYDNVVAVKHVATVKRPKLESRWSMTSVTDDQHLAVQLHTKLAIHIADNYPPARALKLIDSHLATELACEQPVRQIRATVAADLERQLQHEAMTIPGDKPSVVITDIDIASSLASRPATLEHATTAPCTPLESESTNVATPLLSAPSVVPAYEKARSLSMNMLTVQDQNVADSSQEPGDAARKIWRHIRKSSLTAKQLAEIAPEQLQKLEMSDQALMDLRRRALANKRSVGAETLKAWQWDEKALKQRGEMPWM